METNLHGKTVLITESARNFGPETALAFAAEGANLILGTGGPEDELQSVVTQAHDRGAFAVIPVAWDVSDADQVESVIRECSRTMGSPDVVINNASLPMSARSLEEISFADWERKLQVEVTGTTVVCKTVLPAMIERQWGRIITYVGLSAFLGSNAPDSAAELGMVGLARGIARDYGKYNITANCIGPGSIDVERTAGQESGHETATELPHVPVPRHGTVQECSATVVFLASEQAAYVTGQTWLVNGGAYFL